MSGRTEFWLWSGSILGAVALHGGLAALFVGTTALAAVPPQPLRVTISAVPSLNRVEVPVSVAPSAAAVAVQAVAAAVPIQAATTMAPQMAAPVQAIAAQNVTSPVAAPAAPPQAAASPATLSLAAADVAAVAAGAVPAGALAGPAAGASIISPMPEVPLAATAFPVQATAAIESQMVALAAPTTQQRPAAAAVVAPSLAGTPLGAISAAVATPVMVAAQPSTSAPLAAIASGGVAVAAPGSTTSIAAAVAVASAPSAGPSATAPASPQSPVGAAVAVAPAGSAQQVIAGEETVLVADAPDTPVVEAPVAATVPTADALLTFLAGYEGGTCFAARVDTIGETATLSAFAVDFADSVALQLALGQSFDEPVDVDGYRAEPSQCGALAFVSRLQRLAGAPLVLMLDAERLADGETMTGTLVGPSDAAFHLFVVDDEGMVSAANAYLGVRGGSAAFAFPVHLTGDAAAKLQLVIGLATTLDLLPPAERQPADPFFAALTQRLVEAGDSAAIAIAAFSVE